MINGQSVLGFIPARGGSKGLPNKNILKLNGKELIGYTIEAALKSRVCDQIIVSTDDPGILAVSKRKGALVPFLRPKKLSKDDSKMMDAISHAIDWYEKRNKKYDIFLYLQPTSPLRNEKHILEAFEVFYQKNADVVISVNEVKHIPQRMNQLPESLNMSNFLDKKFQHSNRQEFEKYYELNGAIHIAKWNIMKTHKNWFVKNSFAYLLSDPYWLDIDCQLDFDYTEYLLKNGKI